MTLVSCPAPLMPAGRAVAPTVLVLAALVLAGLALAPGAAAAARDAAVQPHKAVYEIEMDSRRDGADVGNVRGGLSFEWGETCDGWVVNQRFDADFIYINDPPLRISWTYATWEAKDGSRYRFNLRKRTNGTLSEELRGIAEMPVGSGVDRAGGRAGGRGGGRVTFSQPAPTDLPLEPGTVFPINHNLRMIRTARSGERLLLVPQFDGSELDRGALVNVVVGRPVDTGPAAAGIAIDDPGIDAALLTDPAWPMRLAYFAFGSVESTPQHEQTVVMQANGIVRDLVLDYGDFIVRGTLRGLESRPRPTCPP